MHARTAERTHESARANFAGSFDEMLDDKKDETFHASSRIFIE
jgi:hypothetical protein